MPTIPTEQEVLSWLQTLSNRGRWGEDDRLGTLNLITTEVRVDAARLVTEGVTVSLAWDITVPLGDDQTTGQPERRMLATGETSMGRLSYAAEFLGIAYHGMTVTHLDSLAHIFVDGAMYNGYPASAVTADDGATKLAVTEVRDGVQTRGVLLDVAGARDVPWLDGGDGAFPEDLESAESRQGVRVREGDAVFLRTGYARQVRERSEHLPQTAGRPGWHAACLPWLHERGVALIGSDTAQDVMPSGYPALGLPVHAVGMAAMGLWLVDNCDLEPLQDTCQRLSRWTFQFTLAPLRFVGATGSPANPIASF